MRELAKNFSKEDLRTVALNGFSKTVVEATKIIIKVSMEFTDSDYKRLLESGDDAIAGIKQVIDDIFPCTANYTLANYHVENKHNYIIPDNIEENVYVLTIVININLPYSKDSVNSAINAIVLSPTKPNVSVRYEYEDNGEVEKQLLKEATNNAKAKASSICQVTSSNLSKLLSVSNVVIVGAYLNRATALDYALNTYAEYGGMFGNTNSNSNKKLYKELGNITFDGKLEISLNLQSIWEIE